jgi:hypothetical protein
MAGVAGAAALVLAACGQPTTPTHVVEAKSGSVPGHSATGRPPVLTSVYPKVMIIAEENHPSTSVVGSSSAPYVTSLASTYGNATNMIANYPVACPSLAAYILITSGSRQNICDDGLPVSHRLSVDNIFRQIAVVHKEWREYAEAMTSNCQKVDGPPGGYAVRHAPSAYYLSEVNRCPLWHVPMGTTSSGHLHDDLASGLPDFSFVTPDLCHDMHGATTCPGNMIAAGDDWLSQWMPKIIASDDFQKARLLVIITWDEGSPTDNRIPTLVIGKTISHLASSAALTHCSTLRTAEELLQLPYLGCAATAVSFRSAFHF